MSDRKEVRPVPTATERVTWFARNGCLLSGKSSGAVEVSCMCLLSVKEACSSFFGPRCCQIGRFAILIDSKGKTYEAIEASAYRAPGGQRLGSPGTLLPKVLSPETPSLGSLRPVGLATHYLDPGLSLLDCTQTLLNDEGMGMPWMGVMTIFY